ncbi:MAG: hypothetical protein V7L25_34315 [Nostoc sp.]|uniref:hypothetical protein n=1 Tax=Nostoc sp. TaxID=1180 RepID=UPI002FEF3CCC
MNNRLSTPLKNTHEATSTFSILSTGGMFQPSPFVAQAQTVENSQQSDMRTSLRQAERYGHHLSPVQPIGISEPSTAQGFSVNQTPQGSSNVPIQRQSKLMEVLNTVGENNKTLGHKILGYLDDKDALKAWSVNKTFQSILSEVHSTKTPYPSKTSFLLANHNELSEPIDKKLKTKTKTDSKTQADEMWKQYELHSSTKDPIALGARTDTNYKNMMDKVKTNTPQGKTQSTFLDSKKWSMNVNDATMLGAVHAKRHLVIPQHTLETFKEKGLLVDKRKTGKPNRQDKPRVTGRELLQAEQSGYDINPQNINPFKTKPADIPSVNQGHRILSPGNHPANPTTLKTLQTTPGLDDESMKQKLNNLENHLKK